MWEWDLYTDCEQQETGELSCLDEVFLSLWLSLTNTTELSMKNPSSLCTLINQNMIVTAVVVDLATFLLDLAT